jgi:hypothetical protein
MCMSFFVFWRALLTIDALAGSPRGSTNIHKTVTLSLHPRVFARHSITSNSRFSLVDSSGDFRTPQPVFWHAIVLNGPTHSGCRNHMDLRRINFIDNHNLLFC